MKLALFKIPVFVVGAFPLLIGMDAIAFPGPPPGPPPSMGPGPGVGGPRMPAGGPPAPADRVCLQAGLHAPADSIAHRCPAGSAVGVFPATARLFAPDISGQALAGWEAWLRTASLRAAGPTAGPSAPDISRSGSNLTGGLAPNSKLAGGGNNQPQLPSTVQSLPKGSGSVLPSVAQGMLPGAGPEGKGFPDFSGKGPGELQTERRRHLITSSFGRIGVNRIRANLRIFRRTVAKTGTISRSSGTTRI